MATFIIATNTGNGLPDEPFRAWAVAYWDKSRNGGLGAWVMEKDWEKLPDGALFAQISVSGYNPISINDWNNLAPGIPTAPGSKDFEQPSNTNFSVLVGSNTALNLTAQPTLTFRNTGEFAGTFGRFGIRIAEGSSTPSGMLNLRSTNKYYFVEGGGRGSRIIVRAPETYGNK
jgi:hypothetical protein